MKGIYLRNLKKHGTPKTLVQYFRDNDFDYAALHVLWNTERTVLRYAEALASINVMIGFYATPEAFKPANWRKTLMEMDRIAQEFGGEYDLIANPESGWPNTAKMRAEARELAHVLVNYGESKHCAWAWVVSYPAHPMRKYWVDADLVGSPEVYDRFNDQPASYPARWIDRWEKLGWYEVVPSLAGWGKTAAQMKTYLGNVPGTSGIFWVTSLPKGAVLKVMSDWGR
jgi:hypothetical protein